MNPHILLITVGVAYIVILGGNSLLRREGLSTQFAIEVLVLTLFVVAGSLITDTDVNPILFLVFIYLISMRGRLLADLANYLSNRGRQRDAISLLQLALRLYPDQNTRMIVTVNMGIVQLRRKNPESAQVLFEKVLQETQNGVALGTKYRAACHYNLGLALLQQGKEAEAVRQLNEAIGVFPNSIYSKAAEIALEKRRSGELKPIDKSSGEL